MGSAVVADRSQSSRWTVLSAPSIALPVLTSSLVIPWKGSDDRLRRSHLPAEAVVAARPSASEGSGHQDGRRLVRRDPARKPPPSDTGQGSGHLTVLSNVARVEEAFNADKGHARLVLILSPT